ncbi:hypothetical protein Psed_6886 (plasmid) [Pseudonocardia dioxanivorans CB1190]|jgi:uncharacterized phage-associated protein|uniref:Antitoxin SocA-like Panacea domain-containing protein n=1 Tax=Pseudonocardia dioxanivorans (strain ATCC 55486 / DSM 44775 / JCM 13855 / CB1190) TaxID=675635 RepID=F2L6Y1_PSEUX|nr:type II toxin-antitoxin system antitoxin SocA domain-containing protein [Pseudonocardia dioxanivorans]AEA28954.1 hypothetical protein Psed_6886 [Pseudonocardia dioxanivorans CB1190]
MAQVADVAAYILSKHGPMTAMKLQKLVYYCQAWHLVWAEQPMFSSEIQAWANGPVVYDLYKLHRGRFTLNPGEIPGDPDALDGHEKYTVDAIIDAYGDKSAHWLSELTHAEDPWRNARERAGLGERDRGDAPIELADMAEYYDSLTSSNADAV